ncbi:MAG: TonB-dependent receptor [bacterium]
MGPLAGAPAEQEPPPQAPPARTEARTPYDLEPIVVRSIRIRQAERDPSSFASVVEAAPYKAQFRTVPDLLSRQPGVHLSQFGGLGQFSTVSIRGSSAEQVLVLLDGIPLNSGEGGSVDLSSIPLEALERIEIVRGGGSAVYGPDAMGGVVNLITRKPAPGEAPQVDAQVTYGSLETIKAAATATGTAGGLGFTLSATHLQSEGDFEFETLEIETENGQPLQRSRQEQRINNDFSSQDLLTRVTYAPWKNLELDLSNELFYTDRGQPGFGERQSATARQKYLRDATYLKASVPRFLGDSCRLNGTLFQRFDRISFEDPEPALGAPIDTLSREYAYGGRLEAEIYRPVLSSDHVAALGWDIEQEELREEVAEGQSEFGSPGRTTNSLYLRDEVVLPGGRVSLLGAGRIEHSSDEGVHPSGKIGLVWKFLWKLHFKANLERAYRRPSFRELYHPDEGWIRGNPGLDAELSTGGDFGLGLNLPRLFFEASGFYNRIENSILWLPVSAFTLQPVNTGSVESLGTEIDLEAKPWDFLSLLANYTYVDAQSEETGLQLAGRPRHTVNARAALERTFGSIYSEVQYVSRIPVVPTGELTLGWRTVVDAGLKANLLFLPGLERLKWVRSLNAGLDVKNVGDVSFRDAQNFPLPGRLFLGTLEARF